MISYLEEDKKFNFRVGAIILNEDKTKVLLHKFENFDFWLVPGGRVEMLEDTKTSLAREIREEISVESKVECLLLNSETFFNFRNVNYHEIGYYYSVKLEDNKFYKKEEFLGIEGDKKLYYKWFAINDLNKVNIKPKFLTDYLQKGDYTFEHIIDNQL